MDTHRLAVFRDLAQTLNYTQTAERMYLSQATVSKYIMSLEKEFGIKLFNRSHRKVELTEQGAAILPAVKSLMSANGELLTQVEQLRHAQEATLVVRTIPSLSHYREFAILMAFAKANPSIDVQLEEAEAETLISSVDERRCDAVFMRIFNVANCRYDHLLGEEDRFVAVVPRGNPLSLHPSLTVRELAGSPLLLLDESTNLYDPVLRMFSSAGITPHLTYTGKRLDLILGMVARGMGISIAMRGALPSAAPTDVAYVPIDPGSSCHMAFVREPNIRHSAASDAFWDYCRSHGMAASA